MWSWLNKVTSKSERMDAMSDEELCTFEQRKLSREETIYFLGFDPGPLGQTKGGTLVVTGIDRASGTITLVRKDGRDDA